MKKKFLNSERMVLTRVGTKFHDVEEESVMPGNRASVKGENIGNVVDQDQRNATMGILADVCGARKVEQTVRIAEQVDLEIVR